MTHGVAGVPAVIFDRDDTLIRCTGVAPPPGNDLGDPALVQLMPGALEAVRSLRNAGFLIAVATNQGGVARGRYGVLDVEAVNARVNQLLDGMIEAFRFCPYHPQGTVPDFTREDPGRKPAPGMLLDLAHTLGLDLSRSWMVGDSERDIQAGRAAGCATVLVPLDWPPADTLSADHAARSLQEAAGFILRNRRQGTGS